MISENVSHYRVLRKLGAGGMGEVYLAEDVRLGRHVALKFLSASSTSDPERGAKFLKEAQAASALRSPHIAAIYDIGDHDGALFIAMEYVEGELVSQRIERGPLPVEQVIDLAVQAADGLGEAHAQGIVHCDVKSSNLIVNDRGVLKIFDFGIARITSPIRLSDTDSTEPMGSNEPGAGVFGTVSYMSPEQALGRAVDHRSDIFSLGVALYEMLTGILPFKGPNPAATIDRILHHQPAAMARLNDSVPAELERIVLKCLQKDRERRYQSMAELSTDLRNLQGDSDPGVTVEISSGTQRLQKSRKTIDSLAILPFNNDSGDPELEYLSDGITESIINNISQLPRLRVMARSTVFQYKVQSPEQATVDPRGVGRELNVRAVLTGRVQQRGERLVVKAELVDTIDGSQLWGEQYHRELADIFTIEEEIAREISEKLRLRLSKKQKSRLSRRHTRNTRAYQHYLKGRYYWNRRTEDSLKKGIEEFHQAITIDPNYALAYAGLADSYIILSGYTSMLPEDVFPTAKAAAMKALRLDESLAEAHTSLAAVRAWYEWDWEGAERRFNRALELNPSYATAFLWYGLTLAARQKLDEALTAVRRAEELDPLSVIINLNVARVLYFARRYDEAVEQCIKVLEMEPNFALTYRRLGQIYTQQRVFDKAITEFQKALEIEPQDSETMSVLAFAHCMSGNPREAEQILSRVEAMSKQTFVSPYSFARIHTGLGNKDLAFEWLDKTCREQHGIIAHLQVEPVFDSLRDDPRFADLLRRIGLLG